MAKMVSDSSHDGSASDLNGLAKVNTMEVILRPRQRRLWINRVLSRKNLGRCKDPGIIGK